MSNIKYIAILLLMLSLDLSVQSQTVAATSESAKDGTKTDSLEQFLMQKLEIPPQFTLLSSDVLFACHREIFKSWYAIGNRRYNSQVQAFINHAKSKDYIIFENIKVMKEGKVLRWPNKTIKF